MKRRIICIDREKCNGCGACAAACHEGAIEMREGKARLVREHHCDGLGDCLPACPVGAISFEERDAPAYVDPHTERTPCSFVGRTRAQGEATEGAYCPSHLSTWPVQLKLVPVHAPYFEGAHLLIAADCTAYAYGNFHRDFIRNRIVLIGCPKLDAVEYTDKLTEILKNHDIKSLTVVRMEVPCCGGIALAAERALRAAGKWIPWQIVTVSTEGKILD